MTDVKLPELPPALENQSGPMKAAIKRYTERAVRQALENQERVCCVETDYMGMPSFTKHNLPPGNGLAGLAIIPLPEGL